MDKFYDVPLNLYDYPSKAVKIKYTRADFGVYPLRVSLLRHESPFAIPEDAIIEINFMNSKGQILHRVGEVISCGDGLIEYNFVPEDIDAVGDLYCAVTVNSPGSAQRLTFPEFKIEVSRSLAGDGEPPEAETPWFALIMAKLAELESKLDDHISRCSCGSDERAIVGFAIVGKSQLK